MADLDDVMQPLVTAMNDIVHELASWAQDAVKSLNALTASYRAMLRKEYNKKHPHCAGCGRFVKAHRDHSGTVLWTECDIHGCLGPRERK